MEKYKYTYYVNYDSLSIYNGKKVIMIMESNLVMSLIDNCPHSYKMVSFYIKHQTFHPYFPSRMPVFKILPNSTYI